MGATTVLLFYSQTLLFKPPVYCAGDKEQTSASTPFASSSKSTSQIFPGGSPDYSGATFGVAMGFCSGYLVKKAGKLAALAVGAGFVFLQVMEHNGYISISWQKFEEQYTKELDFDGDGKVTGKDAKVAVDQLARYLGGKWQMNGGFAGGFLLGLRFG